ncbi:MAG: hypothetical protein GF331_18140 [Chitinivibrionales bacterium]|nr:hypothetical protein [Chitinivibrionales bacterium]
MKTPRHIDGQTPNGATDCMTGEHIAAGQLTHLNPEYVDESCSYVVNVLSYLPGN